MKNPLLEAFDLSPFSKIKTSDFKPAFSAAIEMARKEIDAIAENPESPTFENTIAALDYSGYQLDRVSSIFFNLNSAETTPEIQALAQEISPMLSEFSNDITLNEALFKRVKAVYDKAADLDLNPEEQMLLDKKFRHFQRNGALLGEDAKKELRKLDTELAKLKLTFGEHVLEETNRFELVLEEEKDLAGLPKAIREQAAAVAAERKKKGWVFTLDYPSYIPFMKYSGRRELRKKMALAFGSKGFHKDELDNREIVLEIARLRYQRARLLGFDSHAHFVLEERMAKSPAAVEDFLHELLEKALPAAHRDLKELKEFATETEGVSELQKWDNAYFSEKLKQQKHALDDETLKPFFPLESVLEGVFTVAGKLFGLRFAEAPEVDKYHEEVRVFRVFDEENKFISLFYADFHPRPGKRGGAWMTSYKPQFRKNGMEERPHISIVCNFSRPNGKIPSLLTFNEVTTLFHEFGHALHGMLANTTYPGLSGTSVYWDFVELPSQIMENWCYEPEALRLFARHYESGEAIPEALVEKIKASANFQEGMATVRQISFGLLDMAWHGTDPTEIKDVKEYEVAAFEKTRLFPEHPDTCMSTSFSHIFQGGYSSGYYSYKWAEVLDADAFAYFKEKGIFNSKIASLFREHILSRGGTEDPMELYKRFRGREPDIQALLERAGLLETH